MKAKLLPLTGLLLACFAINAPAQQNDATAPLHLMKPDYPTPYGAPAAAEVKKTLDRVLTYLEGVTPARLINAKTKAVVSDYSHIDADTILAPGDYRLFSYEWGVTYAGMMQAGAASGDQRYTDYAYTRLKFLTDVMAAQQGKATSETAPLRRTLDPHALDDIGALCAAAIKAKRAGAPGKLEVMIDVCREFIMNKEFRLKDGTIARNRPQANTLWLDDMFMALPAVAQLGKLTGERKYYDEVVKQVQAYSQRMFNKDKGLYMHGWVQGMEVHPEMRWARANGWAVMTLVEILDVLPKDHPGYPVVLEQLRAHVKGLVALQHGTGFWHQLLDRPDSYLETSATAIYTYALARAMNQGYIDKLAYTPATMLAWNAVATKVNAKGLVEGTCVGTGMGFDPAFYYYRPVNVYAAHSYGPVLLAGAEILTLLKNNQFKIDDSSLQLVVK
ncbi:MAG: glycoside hydrolase family 105 protein [Gammaproteobacteria bacterium]